MRGSETVEPAKLSRREANLAKAPAEKARGGKAKATPKAKKVGAKAKAIAMQKARDNYKKKGK